MNTPFFPEAAETEYEAAVPMLRFESALRYLCDAAAEPGLDLAMTTTKKTKEIQAALYKDSLAAGLEATMTRYDPEELICFFEVVQMTEPNELYLVLNMSSFMDYVGDPSKVMWFARLRLVFNINKEGKVTGLDPDVNDVEEDCYVLHVGNREKFYAIDALLAQSIKQPPV